MARPTITAHPDQWAKVAEAVRSRRFELGRSQDELGVSKAVVSLIENNGQDTYTRDSLVKLARSLKWQPNSIERILAGGEPVAVGEPPTPVEDAYARLAAEVVTLRQQLERLTALERKVDDLNRTVAELRSAPPEPA